MNAPFNASEMTQNMAHAIRFLAMDGVERAKSGHPGMPMGMAEVATTLFTRHLKYDPASPHWPDRDRFVLSAGHGSMLLYALTYLSGFADMDADELKRFRQLGSKTPGHPEYGHTLGVETTAGPLGQGVSTAVGMALAERMMNARFGDALVDHFTYVIVGDGCLMEGVSQEAIDLAGHLKLGRLIVMWDDNAITIDGSTALSTSVDMSARFAASGWHVQKVDAYDVDAIDAALAMAKTDPRPSFIACKSVIGKGAPNLQGSEKTHGAPLGALEIAAAREAARWPYEPFEVPAHVLAAWRDAASRHRKTRENWEDRLKTSADGERFAAMIEGDVTQDVTKAMSDYKATLVADKPSVATRKASEMALAVINSATEMTIGGSADLTHSNLTLTKGMGDVSPGDYAGRYIRYGVREHGMAAAMNGLALHGGFTPYGGAFLVFADYARGAMRLSALMEQRVIYVLTHDSIGLGEDGPTHQPIEHLAMLRATPNMLVFRPCDAVETAECWELALASRKAPSVLALSRQNLPTLREDARDNLSARGAYVLRGVDGARDVTILATGSEVEIAVAAAAKLAKDGLKAAVVSMPSWELFEKQPDDYRRDVLGSAPRIGVEALARLGWDRWIGERGVFIGMTGFGASAPGPELYRHFAITPEAVADAARRLIA